MWLLRGQLAPSFFSSGVIPPIAGLRRPFRYLGTVKQIWEPDGNAPIRIVEGAAIARPLRRWRWWCGRDRGHRRRAGDSGAGASGRTSRCNPGWASGLATGTGGDRSSRRAAIVSGATEENHSAVGTFIVAPVGCIIGPERGQGSDGEGQHGQGEKEGDGFHGWGRVFLTHVGEGGQPKYGLGKTGIGQWLSPADLFATPLVCSGDAFAIFGSGCHSEPSADGSESRPYRDGGIAKCVTAWVGRHS